jgi:uncharacterized protein (TIGR01244 family)
MFQAVNERLAIAGALVQADIERLAEQGYRSIIDVRSDEEPLTAGLRPSEERQRAVELGLSYQQIPVVFPWIESACIGQVRAALESAVAPALLHCASGRRAGYLALIHLGCQGRWSAEQCLSHAPCLGLDIDSMPAMRDIVLQYVTSHAKAEAGCRRPHGANI